MYGYRFLENTTFWKSNSLYNNNNTTAAYKKVDLTGIESHDLLV
jgi:hypothetical protein